MEVLNHSVLHPAFPLLREWAMLSTRNLTEGNEENQSWIRAMKPSKPVPSKELEEKGMKLVFDQVRLKLVKSPKCIDIVWGDGQHAR